MQSIFSDQSGIKSQSNKGKISAKFPNVYKLNNISK